VELQRLGVQKFLKPGLVEVEGGGSGDVVATVLAEGREMAISAGSAPEAGPILVKKFLASVSAFG
jgi:hypothetical protein